MVKKYYKAATFILAILFAIGIVYYYNWHSKVYPTTDNAYLKANVVKLSTDVSGKIDRIYVQNYQDVKKGTIILKIDQKQKIISKSIAEKELQSAIDNMAISKDEIKMAEEKVEQNKIILEKLHKQYNDEKALTGNKRGAHVREKVDIEAEYKTAQKQVDIDNLLLRKANNQYIESKNNVAISQEKLKKINLELEGAVLKAPTDGTILGLDERVGDYVSAGKPFVSLIETNGWWIEANYKETQLLNIRPGNTVKIKLDMYPNHQYSGVVVAISSASGTSLSVLPAENAIGNWIKITQRFTVKIKLLDVDAKYPLRVGASCVTTINTKS